MRVVLLPHHSDNPYQARLAGELEACGVNVRLLGPTRHWARVVGDLAPDVVHFHWLHDLMLARGRLRSEVKACRLHHQLRRLSAAGATAVWTCHNLVNHRGWHVPLEKRRLKRLIPLFDQVIFHDQNAMDAAAEFFETGRLRSHGSVTPHGSYVADHPVKATRQQARRDLALPAEDQVYLLFGQLRANKGVLEILEGFERFRIERAEAGRVSRVRLLLAGAPERGLVDALSRRAASQSGVDLRLGYVDAEQVETYHRAADVAVFPYRSGLTSGAQILASGFGLPLLVTRRSGHTPDAAAGGSICVESPSPAELAMGLHRMEANRARWPNMGSVNRAAVAQHTWRGMAEKTLAAYENAVRAHRER